LLFYLDQHAREQVRNDKAQLAKHAVRPLVGREQHRQQRRVAVRLAIVRTGPLQDKVRAIAQHVVVDVGELDAHVGIGPCPVPCRCRPD